MAHQSIWIRNDLTDQGSVYRSWEGGGGLFKIDHRSINENRICITVMQTKHRRLPQVGTIGQTNSSLAFT
jgi:hypothetical protein